MTIGCEMSPCGRRQRGGDGVEAGCYLDKDETGVVERVRIVNSGFGDKKRRQLVLLPLLGARGLAVGYRKVHCCCSDEGGRMRGDSQLIGSPRLTAFFPVPVIAAGARAIIATTFRLIAPSLGNSGLGICHLRPRIALL